MYSPSASPFAAAVVLARKKNGKWRFCVDFRGLNKVTVPDNYPLPRIDAIFDQLGNSRYFTMLDAQSGYWQIPMAPEDIHKTAFITHRGLREFVRMPFGLTGAPATYQRVMDITLSDEIHGPEPVATQYLDDTCVHTEAWEKHLEALDTILTKLAAINLKLCPTKCLFGANEAEHLGHIVRENQLLPDPEKVKAVASWMTPINVSEVRAFLGMVGYYRHFIANFSRTAKPLHHLTKLGTAFEWSPEQARAFATLKKALCTAPILVRPDPREAVHRRHRLQHRRNRRRSQPTRRTTERSTRSRSPRAPFTALRLTTPPPMASFWQWCGPSPSSFALTSMADPPSPAGWTTTRWCIFTNNETLPGGWRAGT